MPPKKLSTDISNVPSKDLQMIIQESLPQMKVYADNSSGKTRDNLNTTISQLEEALRYIPRPPVSPNRSPRKTYGSSPPRGTTSSGGFSPSRGTRLPPRMSDRAQDEARFQEEETKWRQQYQGSLALVFKLYRLLAQEERRSQILRELYLQRYQKKVNHFYKRRAREQRVASHLHADPLGEKRTTSP